jgi:hypothetical protein
MMSGSAASGAAAGNILNQSGGNHWLEGPEYRQDPADDGERGRPVLPSRRLPDREPDRERLEAEEQRDDRHEAEHREEEGGGVVLVEGEDRRDAEDR